MHQLDFDKRLAEAIEAFRLGKGITQADMAELLGMDRRTYIRALKGESHFNVYHEYMFYHTFGFLFFQIFGDSDHALQCASDLLELRPAAMSFIHDIIKFEKNIESTTASNIPVIVPTGNLQDGMVYDSCSLTSICLDNRHPEVTCGIKITSNHLHPVYNMDDILLISKRPPRNGDTAIFIDRTTSAAYIRRFIEGDVCRLEPINGYGDTFYVRRYNQQDLDRWIKFGVVISKRR